MAASDGVQYWLEGSEAESEAGGADPACGIAAATPPFEPAGFVSAVSRGERSGTGEGGRAEFEFDLLRCERVRGRLGRNGCGRRREWSVSCARTGMPAMLCSELFDAGCCPCAVQPDSLCCVVGDVRRNPSFAGGANRGRLPAQLQLPSGECSSR